jgi:hypothetical protein
VIAVDEISGVMMVPSEGIPPAPVWRIELRTNTGFLVYDDVELALTDPQARELAGTVAVLLQLAEIPRREDLYTDGSENLTAVSVALPGGPTWSLVRL